MTTEDDNFFSRWSRRKVQVRSGQPLPVESTAPMPPVSMARAARPQAPDLSTSAQPPADAAPPQPVSEKPPMLTLDDVAQLTRDADFKPFIGRQVPAEVRNAAMKKLFTDPHYNVMDGLDIYIDDYSQPSPLSAAMMAKMVGAQFLKLVDDPNEAKPAAVAVAPASDAAAQAAPTDSDAPAQPPADTTGAESEAAPDTPTGAATAPAQPEHHDDHADLQLQPDHAPERESPGRGAG